MFASKVRAGLTPHTRADLFPMLKASFSQSARFANLPSSKTGHWGEGITADDMTALRWVKPKVMVEVSFVEWTRDGLLRHPEFIGVRDAKLPVKSRRDARCALLALLEQVAHAGCPDAYEHLNENPSR